MVGRLLVSPGHRRPEQVWRVRIPCSSWSSRRRASSYVLLDAEPASEPGVAPSCSSVFLRRGPP
eukprot:4045943-Pyramimonas_sp.AAC.1